MLGKIYLYLNMHTYVYICRIQTWPVNLRQWTICADAILSQDEDEHMDTDGVSSKVSSSLSSSTVQPTEAGGEVSPVTNINDTLVDLRDLVRTEMASLKGKVNILREENAHLRRRMDYVFRREGHFPRDTKFDNLVFSVRNLHGVWGDIYAFVCNNLL